MHLDLPQFLSNQNHIEIGSNSFYGCIKRLLLNNQIYTISDSNGKLLEKQVKFLIKKNQLKSNVFSFLKLAQLMER